LFGESLCRPEGSGKGDDSLLFFLTFDDVHVRQKKLIFAPYIYSGYVPHFIESVINVAMQNKDKLFFQKLRPRNITRCKCRFHI
jgi:hypothetical protein